MELKNIEIGATLKYTDEDGAVTNFTEGDNVICHTKDEKNIGILTLIGYYGDTKEVAININTSDKNNPMKFTSVIVKASDIVHICKNPLADDVKELTQDEINKKIFVSTIVGFGYDNSAGKIDNLWDKSKKTMGQFDIPLDKMMACTIYSLENKCGINVPLKDMCGVDIEYINNTLLPQMESAAFLSLGMVGKYALEMYNALFGDQKDK